MRLITAMLYFLASVFHILDVYIVDSTSWQFYEYIGGGLHR